MFERAQPCRKVEEVKRKPDALLEGRNGGMGTWHAAVAAEVLRQPSPTEIYGN